MKHNELMRCKIEKSMLRDYEQLMYAMWKKRTQEYKEKEVNFR